MNHNLAIKVEGLCKKYRLGERPNPYDTIRDSFTNGIKKIRRRLTAGANGNAEKQQDFWALQDIAFEIKPGETVGIVGRNGAGKSTLLKILSRITEPTKGAIDIYGRVGSLLEVGTGFHNELTGRENIFLSGAVLGMKKAEIERQFDEIVAFAEIENFVDTPVKHYSSGMYLRLAFGVAAHLQPEILLVDEVLAVGDVVFQQKCLGKMNDVAKQGRTVLFVSHNMSAIVDLCQRGLLIEKGRLKFDGTATSCVEEYYKNNSSEEFENKQNTQNTPFNVDLLKVNDSSSAVIESGGRFDVSLRIHGQKIRNPAIFFVIENVSGQLIVHKRISSKELGTEIVDGYHKLKISLPELWISPGIYSIYFKFIAPATNWSGRLNSERIMLEVRGELERTGKALLNPEVEWSLDSHEVKPNGKLHNSQAPQLQNLF